MLSHHDLAGIAGGAQPVGDDGVYSFFYTSSIEDLDLLAVGDNLNHRMRQLIRLYFAYCCAGLSLAGPGRAQTFFEDVTEETINTKLFISSGMAFGDYNNDGWPDVVLQELFGPRRRVRLLHNEGNGRLTDQSAAFRAGDLQSVRPNAGVLLGDYDFAEYTMEMERIIPRR